jgi:hypothetical protein
MVIAATCIKKTTWNVVDGKRNVTYSGKAKNDRNETHGVNAMKF